MFTIQAKSVFERLHSVLAIVILISSQHSLITVEPPVRVTESHEVRLCFVNWNVDTFKPFGHCRREQISMLFNIFLAIASTHFSSYIGIHNLLIRVTNFKFCLNHHNVVGHEPIQAWPAAKPLSKLIYF